MPKAPAYSKALPIIQPVLPFVRPSACVSIHLQRDREQSIAETDLPVN